MVAGSDVYCLQAGKKGMEGRRMNVGPAPETSLSEGANLAGEGESKQKEPIFITERKMLIATVLVTS